MFVRSYYVCTGSITAPKHIRGLIYMENWGSVEGVKTRSVTELNSIFTNPVCPHPRKLWPCIETAWLSADWLGSAAALWYQGGLERRVGRVATKAFCCSLGVGLPALLSAVGSNFTFHMSCIGIGMHMQAPNLTGTHTRTHPRTHAQLLQSFVCLWFLEGTSEVCLSSIQATTPGQKQPHNQSAGWHIVIVL